jgi:peptide-methionine (S)-S-oxide reductase
MTFRSVVRTSAAVAVFLGFAFLVVRSSVSAKAVTTPNPVVDDSLAATSGKLTVALSGACFWGIQLVYEHVKGVMNVTAGHSGGTTKDPSYEMVSSGTTGHAESVKIVYDPSQVTFGQLLKVFFSVAHDPTELNRQGPDEGTQYRSAIFYTNDQQQRIARAYDATRSAQRVLHGGGLPPGLCVSQSHEPLHHDQRPPKGRSPAQAAPRSLCEV